MRKAERAEGDACEALSWARLVALNYGTGIGKEQTCRRTGVARGRLDEGSARLDDATALSILDHALQKTPPM